MGGLLSHLRTTATTTHTHLQRQRGLELRQRNLRPLLGLQLSMHAVHDPQQAAIHGVPQLLQQQIGALQSARVAAMAGTPMLAGGPS